MKKKSALLCLMASGLAGNTAYAGEKIPEHTAQKAPDSRQSVKGWYATVGAGFVAPQSPSISLKEGDFSVNGSQSQNTSFAGEVGIGYDFGPARGELTYTYTPISTSSLSINDGAFTSVETFNYNVNLSAVMLSAYYDLKNKSKLTPYLGGGLGPGIAVTQQRTLYSGEYVNAYTPSQSNTVLTYQLKAGVSYAAAPNADFFGEIGYLGFTGASTVVNSAVSVLDISQASNGGFMSKIGFRYRFGR
jgi:opacity protein-like surface antigen